MNNIKTMTNEYRVARESGVEAGTRVEMADERREGVFACGNTRSDHGFVPFSEGNGLLLKTNNIFGAISESFRRSDGVSACEGRTFGSNLVRIWFEWCSLDFPWRLAFVPLQPILAVFGSSYRLILASAALATPISRRAW